MEEAGSRTNLNRWLTEHGASLNPTQKRHLRAEPEPFYRRQLTTSPEEFALLTSDFKQTGKQKLVELDRFKPYVFPYIIKTQIIQLDFQLNVDCLEQMLDPQHWQSTPLRPLTLENERDWNQILAVKMVDYFVDPIPQKRLVIYLPTPQGG